MIQLAKCPQCLRQVYPGTRNGKPFAYDYIVNRDGEIISWLPHSETCPWSALRDPLGDDQMKIRDYADMLDGIQMIWKLDCALLEPLPAIVWEDVEVYREQPPLRHVNPVANQLIKAGGPYPKGNRQELIIYFVGTVVNSAKKTVIALMVASELFDKVHEFLYQYDSSDKKQLKQVVVAGYWLILDSTVPTG